MSAEKKTVKITLHKDQIYYDIDSLTYKKADAALQNQVPRVQNAVASDTDEDLDGSIIYRLTEYRDVNIRHKLRFCLKSEPATSIDNNPNADTAFVYNIEVPADFMQDELKVLAVKIHRYIVWGTVFDWFMKCGIEDIDNKYGNGADDLESEIVGILRNGGTRRPLQPFGPAEPI